MSKAWFCTPMLHPHMRVAGPYVTATDCEIECLRRTDPGTVRRFLSAGTMPQFYVPRLFEVAAPHTYIKEEPQPDPRDEAELHRRVRDAWGADEKASRSGDGGGVLPAVVYTYKRSSLLELAGVLAVSPVPQGADRAAIIEHIETELLKLAPASAWRGERGGRGGRQRKSTRG